MTAKQMRSCKRIATIALLGAVSVIAQPVFGQGLALEYSEDFSSDPGWTTDQPGNYYWDSGTETYHATTENAPPGAPAPPPPPPTRYAYTPINYDGNSLRLEFDMQPTDLQWSAGVHFGLFDEDLAYTNSLAPNASSLNVHMGSADGGRWVGLYACGATGVCQADGFFNLISESTWYRCVVEYTTDTDEAALTVTERDTGTPVVTLTLPNVGGLSADLDYLGFARDPAGADCPSCPGYSSTNQATAFLDNIIFCEESVAPPCDNFEDGVIDPALWTLDGRATGGGWSFSHGEVVATDGYLETNVQGPATGNTYGAEGLVRTSYNFNDGSDWVIDFRWDARRSASHQDSFVIAIGDAYFPPGGVHDGWIWEDLPERRILWGVFNSGGTEYYVEDGERVEHPGAYDDPAFPVFQGSTVYDGPVDWSVVIDSGARTATLYTGPGGTGDVHASRPLEAGNPWHIRLFLSDYTSSGFPAGDNSLYLYDLCSERPLCDWEPLASMPDARRAIASAVVDGKIYVFGDDNRSPIKDRLEVYDPQLDTWTQLANIPTGRGYAAAAAVDGIIYLFGGNDGWNNHWLTTNEAYDPGTDSWTTKTPLQVTDRGGLTATAVDGLIYVMGGGDSYDPTSPYDIVEIYDPASDSWTTGVPMPRRRIHHAAVAIDKKIYLIGGATNNPLEPAPEVDVFDTETGQWTQIAALPSPTQTRILLAATTVGDRIYAIGGTDYGTGEFYSAVDEYVPQLDSWSAAAPLPSARGWHCAATVDHTIYVVGGRDEAVEYLATTVASVPCPSGDVCGDGVVDPTEACDDSNTDDCDGCRGDCSAVETGCGDGFICGSEECDDSGESAACDTDCTFAVCGDGMLNVTNGEVCDDGNNVDCDGCRSDCSAVETGCGDGFVCGPEPCDDGNNSDCDGCRADCSAVETGCGDTFTCGTEECDDGGESPDCDIDCTVAWCGDGVLNIAAGEECDDGNNDDYDGCSAVCTLPDFQYQCVVLGAPGTQDQTTEVPAGLTTVGLRDTFYVEFWATDSGATNTGVVSAYTDMDYPEDLVTCYDPESSPLFSLFPGGACDGLIVDELGGSQLAPDIGVEPEWARIAYGEFTADAIGQADFALQPAATESSSHGRGLVFPEDINYGACRVEIVCPCSYDLDDNCNIAGGDLGLFAPCWSVCDGDPEWDANSCGDKDFDCNGCVSGGDLAWFAVGWGRTCDEIDPIADYPACRQCDPPVYCPGAAASRASDGGRMTRSESATRKSATDPSVLLSLRLKGLHGQMEMASRIDRTRPGSVRAGEHVFAEVWAKDTSPISDGLTVVFTDVHYNPSRFTVVSVDSGDTFTLFSEPSVGARDGVVRRVGGATLESDHGAGRWTRVAVVELKALVDVTRPAVSLRPSQGEAVSRYGQGLVPRHDVRIVADEAVEEKRPTVNGDGQAAKGHRNHK